MKLGNLQKQISLKVETARPRDTRPQGPRTLEIHSFGLAPKTLEIRRF